jgi:septal ring factor EnvC (AmiA/AmiB activator)
MPSSSRGQTGTVKSPRPSNLLAARVVVQPYGFWHRPWARAGAMAAGLMLGVLAASWLLSADEAGPRADSAALKVELETSRRELDAERLRAAELARELEALGRETRRLRDELAAAQQKAAKRRERRESVDEAGTPRPPPADPQSPAVEAPAAAPRAE